MKRTKKMLALLLAFFLAFGFGAPAASAQEEEPQSTVNWDEFAIITPPQAEMTVPHGVSFTLSVEVSVPEGVTVSYQWYRRYDTLQIQGATEPVYQCSPNDDIYPTSKRYPYEPTYLEVYCIISASERDADGNVISSQALKSDYARVTILPQRDRNVLENIRDGQYPFLVKLEKGIQSFFTFIFDLLIAILLAPIVYPLVIILIPVFIIGMALYSDNYDHD